MANPIVEMKTTHGVVKIELYADKAPATVENFLKYVNDKYYDGLIFHRIIDGFMIQGGGFDLSMKQKKSTYAPIKLEVSRDLKHADGAISMARTMDPNSATNQFFICDGPQKSLDMQYAVFGQVIAGMEVVQKISGVKTKRVNCFDDVPAQPVVIESIRVVQ
ncbi:MAG: peptidylprolyl isomerase [Candidatus Thermoplasmatota archaeon]|nr:peptidylprolyl isomerase [Candidatus Thermoplasmatota archaeon]